MKRSQIVVAILIMSFILGAMHIVVYSAITALFVVTNVHTVLALQIIFTLLGVSFIGSLFLSRKYNVFFTRGLVILSSIWLGFLVYLFIGTCIYGLLAPILSLFITDTVVLMFGKILLIVGVLTGIYGVYTAENMRITQRSVSLPTLPESWKHKKAVFLSDLHLGQIRGEKFAEKIVSKIQTLNPDIIFITGDMYDGVKVDPVAIIAPLKKLKPALGTYFVMGNHEEFEDNQKYFSAIESVGIKVLNDTKILIEGVQIVGADYKTTTKKENLRKVLATIGIAKDVPSILLKHVPLNLEEARDAGISLQLSGHTHRAQIFPFTFITKRMYKGYDYGLKPLGSLQVLTTSGVGTWGPPLRVGTKSEIVVIDFL